MLFTSARGWKEAVIEWRWVSNAHVSSSLTVTFHDFLTNIPVTVALIDYGLHFFKGPNPNPTGLEWGEEETCLVVGQYKLGTVSLPVSTQTAAVGLALALFAAACPLSRPGDSRQIP